jgi:hypothetical protein
MDDRRARLLEPLVDPVEPVADVGLVDGIIRSPDPERLEGRVGHAKQVVERGQDRRPRTDDRRGDGERRTGSQLEADRSASSSSVKASLP